jgi:1,4-alpha-glucan branching enzyme
MDPLFMRKIRNVPRENLSSEYVFSSYNRRMHTVVYRSAAIVGLLLAALASHAQVLATKPGTGIRGNPKWTYSNIRPTDIQGDLTITLNSATADLYVRRGSNPTLTAYDFRVTGNAATKQIKITNRTSPALLSETYWVGVYQRSDEVPFTVTRVASSRTSEFTTTGAVPFTNGTSFRVWAPNASAVNVAGQFNSWSTTAAPLLSEGNGYWSLDLRNARAGQQYKYVIRNGTNTFWKSDPWARQLVNSVGNCIIYNPNGYTWTSPTFNTPAFSDTIIYEMHVGTFNDTAGGAPGTFVSAINRLDYLQGMGVNVVHLMPVQEFPGDFSWGYNPSYPYSVESAYGGPDNLKRFIDEAAKRNIAVILDVVHNHYGPTDMDMWRFDGWFSGSPGGGIFFYNDARGNTPWGDTRPDFGRPEVRQYILDNQRMWANDFRAAGFRYDSTVNIRRTNLGNNPDGLSLLQLLNNDLNATQPWKLNVAEDLQSDASVTRSTASGGAGFDTQWSNFVHTIRAQITGADDNSRSMTAVRDALNERFNGDAYQRVIYTESHDENANGKQRVTSTIDSANPASYFAQKRSTLGAALVFTSPGIPMIFQGQELLEDGWFTDTDPVDWAKLTTYAGINLMYKDLISLRRNLGGRTAGLKGQGMNVFHLNDGAKVIAYHRFQNGGANDDVVIVANFKNTTWNNYRIGFPRAGNWSVVFNSDWTGYSSLFSNVACPNVTTTSPSYDGFAQSGTVNLGPYSVVILAKD